MNERKHKGGRPPKPCYTYKNGEIREHADIPTAAAFLGVSGAPGSSIRYSLNNGGVYRPRNGGVCWPVGGELPYEVRERDFREWKRKNP